MTTCTWQLFCDCITCRNKWTLFWRRRRDQESQQQCCESPTTTTTIATPNLEDHIERLDEVFTCMKQAGLKCKPSKCEILRDSIKYLGRLVDKHGKKPDPEAVRYTTDELFGVLLSGVRQGYADKIYPMQQLMRIKGKKFTWTDEAQVSFENIKRELCEAPFLGMPTEKGMFVLVAISGILHQEQSGTGERFSVRYSTEVRS